MSAPAFAWAFETGRRLKLPVSERMLLVALAERSNGEGYCFTGQTTLAGDTGLTERSVRTLTAALEGRGLIRIERRGRLLYYHMIRPNGACGQEIPEPASAMIPEPASATVQPATTIPEAASAVIPEEVSGSVVDTGNPCSGYRKLTAAIPETVSAEPKKLTKKENQEDPPPIIPPPPGGGRVIDPPGFADFWSRYPRKVGRRAAAAAFVAAINRGNTAADILAGLQRHQFHPNPQYQPHPTTWLRADRWLDEVDDFDPVLRAVGLTPDDFRNPTNKGLLQ